MFTHLKWKITSNISPMETITYHYLYGIVKLKDKENWKFCNEITAFWTVRIASTTSSAFCIRHILSPLIHTSSTENGSFWNLVAITMKTGIDVPEKRFFFVNFCSWMQDHRNFATKSGPQSFNFETQRPEIIRDRLKEKLNWLEFSDLLSLTGLNSAQLNLGSCSQLKTHIFT